MKRLAAAGALLVSACVNLNPYQHELRVPAGPQPDEKEVQADILFYLHRSLKDPDSLKQFSYLGMKKTRWLRGSLNGGGSEEGWLACFEYNAKNSYGAYGGVSREGRIYRANNGSPVFVMKWYPSEMVQPGC